MATFGDLKTLSDQLGPDNLTPDLGGNLTYDHATWVSNRLVSYVHIMYSGPSQIRIPLIQTLANSNTLYF